MALMPSAIARRCFVRELFVPIMMTATLGVMPLMLRCRAATEHVRSVAADAAFIGFSGANCLSQAALRAPSPALRDRVAEEDHIDLARHGATIDQVVPVHPFAFTRYRRD